MNSWHFWPYINLPWSHVRYHKKVGPERFSRFNIYWIQTDRHPEKLSVYIDIYLFVCTSPDVCLFESDKRQNGWTDRAQTLCGRITWPQRRFGNAQNYKNLCRKALNFVKFYSPICAENIYTYKFLNPPHWKIWISNFINSF